MQGSPAAQADRRMAVSMSCSSREHTEPHARDGAGSRACHARSSGGISLPAGVPDLDKAQKMSPGQVPCSRKEDAFCWKQGAAPLVTPEGDRANGDSLEVMLSPLLPVV